MRPPTDPILGVVPADPALRRIALGGWVVAAAVGASVLWYVTSVFARAEAMAVYDPRGAFLEVQRIAIPLMVAWTIGGVGVAIYCLVTSLRIIRAARFPLPGARVTRVTPLRTGVHANRVAAMMAVAAIVILAASVAMPVFLRRVMQAMEVTSERFPATPPADQPPPAGTPRS